VGHGRVRGWLELNADLSTGERINGDGWMLRLRARDVVPTVIGLLIAVAIPSGLGLLLAIGVGVGVALVMHAS
jgi:hypothetical protein